MAYEVVVSSSVHGNLHPPVPDEVKNALRSILDDIADNPSVGRVPPCPPFVPHGLFVERWVDYKDRRHTLRVFYEVDHEREQVGVVHISTQPRVVGD